MKKSIIVFSAIPALALGAVAPAHAAEGSQVQYQASSSSGSSSGGLSGLLAKLFGGSSDAGDSKSASTSTSSTTAAADGGAKDSLTPKADASDAPVASDAPEPQPSHVQDGDVQKTADGAGDMVESGRATVLDDFNAYRAGRNLGGITTDEELQKRAQAWADHLSATNGTGHSEIKVPDLGEVIAYTGNPGDVIRMWDESPGHHDIINKGEATVAGIGVATHGTYGQVFVMILR